MESECETIRSLLPPHSSAVCHKVKIRGVTHETIRRPRVCEEDSVTLFTGGGCLKLART